MGISFQRNFSDSCLIFEISQNFASEGKKQKWIANTSLLGQTKKKTANTKKEMMKMVGLSESIYVLSWLLTQSVMLIVAAVLFTGIGYAAKLFVYSGTFFFLFIHVLGYQGPPSSLPRACVWLPSFLPLASVFSLPLHPPSLASL
jgi:hypothetical protein